MTVKLQFQNGESARATHLQDLILHIESPCAFAPGSPVRFTAEVDGALRRFDSRGVGSKRRDGNTFEVRVRLVNLTREDRNALTAALGATSADDPTPRTPTS